MALPKDRFGISDIDQPGSPNYFGFISHSGEWYIMQETVSSPTKSYLYIYGRNNYNTNWSNRTSLTYLTFDMAF